MQAATARKITPVINPINNPNANILFIPPYSYYTHSQLKIKRILIIYLIFTSIANFIISASQKWLPYVVYRPKIRDEIKVLSDCSELSHQVFSEYNSYTIAYNLHYNTHKAYYVVS